MLKKQFVFVGFWGPEASQESLKRPKKAPKRHPKSSKTPKKKIHKWAQTLTNFGLISGQFLGPKIPQKLSQKGTKNWPQNVFWWFSKTTKNHFLNPLKANSQTQFGPNSGASFFQEWAKMSPRGPSGASKSLFKNLKKPRVFTLFWVQRPPKKTSRKKTYKNNQFQRALTSKKKMLKKCLHGKKCLKVAISFLRFFGTNFGGQICTFFNHLLHIFFTTF